MSIPTILNPENAPAEARPALEAVKAKYGFIPNLNGAMAHAPAVLNGYVALAHAFGETSLTPAEQQVVAMAVSFHNECVYCMSGHTMLAHMTGIAGDDVEALRAGRRLADPKLEALRSFVGQVLEGRGQVKPEGVEAFRAAGFSAQQVMEVTLGVAYKTLSNYFHHLHPVEVDEAVASHRWEPPKKAPGQQVLITGWVREGAADELARYQAAAGPIMGRHGGRGLLKTKPSAAVVGDAADVVVLMEFPSADAVAEAFDDPDYQPLIELRDQAFSRLDVVLLGGGQ